MAAATPGHGAGVTTRLEDDLRRARRGDLDAAARFYDETVGDAWTLGRCLLERASAVEEVVEGAYRELLREGTSSPVSARSRLLVHVRAHARRRPADGRAGG